MYNNGIKKRCLQDMSLEEQDDYWQDVVNSRKGRVRLLKMMRLTPKEIEKMYLDYNKIKVINKPILNESCPLKI